MSAAPPLGFRVKFAYGVGQFAEGLKNVGMGTFVLFYYVQVFGVPAWLAGLAVFIALLFDAFTDPLAGSLSDNWQSANGRRHPFMYASALPLALFFFLLFSPPAQWLGQFGLFLWMTVMMVLTRAAMTLYHVPHIALGAELSEDYRERTQIVAYRQFFGTFGGMFATAIGFWWFFADTPQFHNGQLNAAAYGPYALFLGVLMVVTIWWSAWGTRSRLPYLPQARRQVRRLSVGEVALRVMLEALQNRSFAWLFLGVLIVFVMVGVNAALDVYMLLYFWEVDSGERGLLSLPTPVGIMLGALLTPWLHRHFDKKVGVVWGTAWWALCQVVPVGLRLLGAFPDNDSAALVPLLLVIKFLQGVGVVQALVSFGSMVADIADEHELRTGRRQEGIFFGAVSFSGKATSGLGNLFAGIGLSVIAWPSGDHIRTAADVDPDTVVNLGILFGPVVGSLAIVSVWCYSHYRITRARHAQIVADLNARRDTGRDVADAAAAGGP